MHPEHRSIGESSVLSQKRPRKAYPRSLLKELSFERRRAFLNAMPHESKPTTSVEATRTHSITSIGRAKAQVVPEAQYFPSLITADH